MYYHRFHFLNVKWTCCGIPDDLLYEGLRKWLVTVLSYCLSLEGIQGSYVQMASKDRKHKYKYKTIFSKKGNVKNT